MGYTHYWTPKKSSEKKFKDFSNTCGELKRNLPNGIEIGDGMGYLGIKNQPEFSKDKVCFNGVGDDSHETFSVGHKQNERDFCKTAHKPYDLLVCACLLAAVDVLGYEISSDGDIEDWKPAIEYYNEHVKGDKFTTNKLMKELSR